MTVFSVPRLASFDWHKSSHLLPLALAAIVGAGAITVVAHLLWPTGSSGTPGTPDRLPAIIGGTLFNAPVAAIRMKIRRHTGPAERVDLSFSLLSRKPPQ